MPVFNAGLFLKASIESIFCQTHRDLELVIVDDGSTDTETTQLLQQAATDKRVKLIRHTRNMGTAGSINHGLDVATGAYIARMDADDISHPRRLEKQLEFMEANPAVGLCGTAMECFGNVQGLKIVNPREPDDIKCRLLLSCPISHPTVMFRHESLQRYGVRYNEDFPICEDYELWTRCAECFPMANLEAPLLSYRIHGNQTQRTPGRPYYLSKVIKSQFDALNLLYSEEELQAFLELVYFPNLDTFFKLNKLISLTEVLFGRIQRANDSERKYKPEVLRKTLSRFWMNTIAGEQRYSWNLWRRYRRNACVQPAPAEMIRLLVKCLIRWKARDPRRLFEL
jgi:glycosyltransferase involved in cell wall biosynthesis